VNLLRAELRKLLTLPSLRLTALLTLAASLVVPVQYTQAGFVVFGVLAAASEHQGGDQFRATLLAMPRRLPLYTAKMLTLAGVTAPLAAVVAVPSVVPLTLTTLLAAAVGGLIRHAEAAAVLLLVVYFVACPLLRGRFAPFLPDTATLEASRGDAAAVVWALTAMVLAACVFHRRDA
jgi:ABC-2 type transport system permease protein